MPLATPTEFVKEKVLALQEYSLLAGRSLANLFARPRYFGDTLQQADMIGVGSLPIVVLTGFFTGAVLALQSANTLQRFGSLSLIGQLVSLSMVRELGPVLTGLMVAGRNASGMASELGSMQVTEQVDALRMNNVDPIDYLIVPRFIASLVMTGVLTSIGVTVALVMGALTAWSSFHLNPVVFMDPSHVHWGDLGTGIVKCAAYGAAIPIVAGFCGLGARGGSEGVGAATTRAVITSSFVVIVLDFVILLLPLPVLTKLRVPKANKIAVFSIFALGILSVSHSFSLLQ